MYFLPHMGGMLVKNPLVEKTDLSSVTSVHMTGAPTGAALQQLIIDKLPKSAHVGNCEYFMGFFSQLCIIRENMYVQQWHQNFTENYVLQGPIKTFFV